MTASEQREQARERELEALLEQEFGQEAPVEAILQRAEREARAGGWSRTRGWLLAALLLLGVGVTFALAWQQRAADDDVAGRQDSDTPVDLRWPPTVPQVYRPEQISEIPEDTRFLSMRIPLYEATGLSRLRSLEHLDVRLSIKTLARLMREGGRAAGGRLDLLERVRSVRRLRLWMLPVAPSDLHALGHLGRLQVLELHGVVEINDALRAAAAKGGLVPTNPFDAAFGAAVAKHSRARTLRIDGMPITAEGLRALAGAQLHTLILDASAGVTPEALEALGELRTLRHLELGRAHGASVGEATGGPLTRVGSPALSAGVMLRLAGLPALESLTLDACYLDAEAVAALPRTLRRLDLSTCFGVDGGIGEVVAEMGDLDELGLPLQMSTARDYLGSRRMPITGTDLHTRRVAGPDAAAIVASRPWRSLRLDGLLHEDVAEALSSQPVLQELVLTPTAGSASLAFVEGLPLLERVSFVDADLTEDYVKPLGGSQTLRTVVFEDCTTRRVVGGPEQALPERIVVRQARREVW